MYFSNDPLDSSDIDFNLKHCIGEQECKNNVTGSNTRDEVWKFPPDGQIACQTYSMEGNKGKALSDFQILHFGGSKEARSRAMSSKRRRIRFAGMSRWDVALLDYFLA